MKPHLGAWLLAAAAVASLFAPRRRASPQAPPAPMGADPTRLFALVQTRPDLVVLALSAHVEDLEREIEELNLTWNHWSLRTERRRFEIQSAPVLIPMASSPRVREAAVQRR